MADHILGVATYGSQRVKHPRTKQTISAYKLGYTTAARAVLLALYGDQARDVSSRHASYHYIQIDPDVTVRHGYILLKITEAELTQIEALTRQVHRPGMYRWIDSQWQEFPNLKHSEYTPVTEYTGPNFNPTGMRIATISTGEVEAAVSGIQVERSQRSLSDTPWHWLRGDTYPHRDLLKRWGCRWSKRNQAWYYIGTTLPEAIQQLVKAHPPQPTATVSDDDPCSIGEAEAILGVRLMSDKPPIPVSDEPESAPSVRIIKPVLDESDAITSAIRQTQVELQLVTPISSEKLSGKRSLICIPQAPCGELTGSITGNVWCYGWAIHDGACVYLNLGGPRMAVEAIRAKLAKGDVVSCVPWDAPSIELTAGEGNTGKYTAFMQHLPEAKFTSLILLHELVTQPNYGGKSTTFILQVSDEQAIAQLHHHITNLVKVPVFAEWTGYLWQAGQSAMLLRPTRTDGGVKLWTVDLNAQAWTRLITGGLSAKRIALPD